MQTLAAFSTFSAYFPHLLHICLEDLYSSLQDDDDDDEDVIVVSAFTFSVLEETFMEERELSNNRYSEY